MIRLIELFAGYGSQALALKYLGIPFEHHFVCEFDKYAIQSYNEIHGTDFKVSDIRNISVNDLNITETDKYDYLLTYSFPCFIGDTLVLTRQGYKRIDSLSNNDYVLTHTNTYQKVVSVKKTGNKKTFSIKGTGIDEIICTPSHKFYVRKMTRHYPTLSNGKRCAIREFGNPEWVECKDLTKKHYLGVAINQNSIIPTWDGVEYAWSDGRATRHKNNLDICMNNTDFWWIIGRYVGDGWHRSQGGIIICCEHSELSEITTIADRLEFNYSVISERTVDKIHFAGKELEAFVEPFGRGAENKCIPGFVFDMPENLIDAFLQGYVSADGSYDEKQKLFRTSSVSRQLSYGIAQLVAKAYKTPYRFYKSVRSDVSYIEGRLIHQKPSYSVCWKLDKRKQDKAFYENNYIWFPIQSIIEGNVEPVFDIETYNDHSFTANGVIVHNCTDLSLAGKREGMLEGSNTRSSLLWEIKRLLSECKELPQYLLMENVPQVSQNDNAKAFGNWCKFLNDLGYINYAKVLDAKDYGIPQHREREYMVSILKTIDKQFTFPLPRKLNLRLKDMLEDEVDEKYYINNEKAHKLIYKLAQNGNLPKLINHSSRKQCVCLTGMGGEDGKLNAKKIDIAGTICARDYKGPNNYGFNGVIEDV